MKQTPYKGWAIFLRTSRTEWPMIHTVRPTRRMTIGAWKDEMASYNVKDPDAMYRARVADGSIRVGKVIVGAIE